MEEKPKTKIQNICDKKFILIKLHYFFTSSAIATVMILPLIVRQKGISEQLIGILWSILRFIALICNFLSGPLADLLKAHKTMLLFALLSLTTGLTSFYFIPPLSKEQISHSEIKNSFGNYSTPIQINTNRSADYNGLNSRGTTPDDSLALYMSYPIFWVIVIFLLAEQIGIAITTTISDAVCFKILDDEPQKYGQQRVWCTIGKGLFALITGALIDYWSVGKPDPDYTPAYIICAVFMLIDIGVVIRIKILNKISTTSNFHLSSVNSILVSPSTIIFLITTVASGLGIGTTWTFKLMLVEDVSLAWDPQFASLKLLQGLLLSCETFGGEIPFFFFAGRIITKLGSNAVFAVCLATQGLRCIGYYFVSNPWYFLIIEFLQGPAFGLFHTNMVAYTNAIAPAGAQATLQAIARSCFIVGTCIGNLIGGQMYHKYGASVMFLNLGLGLLAYMILYIISLIIITKTTKEKFKDKVGYMLPEVPNLAVHEIEASHSSIVAAVL